MSFSADLFFAADDDAAAAENFSSSVPLLFTELGIFPCKKHLLFREIVK